MRNDPTATATATAIQMPLEIAGLEYLNSCRGLPHGPYQSADAVALATGLPNSAGRRFRGQRLVFSPDEVEQIRRYASLLEPADQPLRAQLNLFNGDARRVG